MIFRMLSIGIFLCLMPMALQAQSADYFKGRYLQAKASLQKQDFKAAEAPLQELQQTHPNNAWRDYGAYLLGLGYFQQKQWAQAEKPLLELLERNPQWENADEALFLLANIAFERREDNIALSYTSKITTIEAMNAANTMKGHFLSKRSLPALKNLQSVYNKDKFIAQLLVDKIAVEGTSLDDLELAERLVEQYKLEKPEKTRLKRIDKILRDTLYVGVMLPFNIQRLKEKNATTQLAIDLYQGMRLAKRELDSAGVNIRLVAYDIRNNPDTLAYMHSLSEFEKIDLFVGPVFEEDFDKMLQIARGKPVLLVNPLQSAAKWRNHRQVYLTNPSLATQAEQSARFGIEKFGKKVLIFHSDLPDDVQLAEQHQQYLRSAKASLSAKIQVSTSNLMMVEKLLEEQESLDYIFVASPSQIVAEEILRQMERLHPNTPIITLLSWRTFQNIPINTFEARQVYFVAPDYLYREKEMEAFRRSYNERALRINKVNNMVRPSVYAFRGYDLMHSFARVLYQQGSIDESSLQDSAFRLSSRGYKFEANKRDNQFVPILRYYEGELRLANRFED
jgi:ABC-type branched-subunit amino acid transport system substrate-binding protein